MEKKVFWKAYIKEINQVKQLVPKKWWDIIDPNDNSNIRVQVVDVNYKYFYICRTEFVDQKGNLDQNWCWMPTYYNNKDSYFYFKDKDYKYMGELSRKTKLEKLNDIGSKRK